MLTDAYTTIDENGKWYIRRDFDSSHYVISEADYQREDETGVPAYIGFQMPIINIPSTIDELGAMAAELAGKYEWATPLFIKQFMRTVMLYGPMRGAAA